MLRTKTLQKNEATIAEVDYYNNIIDYYNYKIIIPLVLDRQEVITSYSTCTCGITIY